MFKLVNTYSNLLLKFLILFVFCIINLSAADAPVKNIDIPNNYITSESLSRIGDYGYPNDPLLDRAKGYLLKGKAKTVIANNGNFITWASRKLFNFMGCSTIFQWDILYSYDFRSICSYPETYANKIKQTE